MTEGYSRPPEEVRQEVLGLLGKIKREDFPTMEMHDTYSDSVVPKPGILLSLDTSSACVLTPSGVFAGSMYFRPPTSTGGLGGSYPQYNSLREARDEVYAEFEQVICEKLEGLKKSRKKR